MACVAKYHRPLNVLDESPRKRRKLTSSWDVLPSELQSQPTIISADPENGNGKESVPISSGAEHSIPSDHSRSASSALKPKAGISRNGSPPWRNDDKDGHYVFELGENLTPRYKILSKMGEGAFGQVLECWDRKSKDFVAIKIVRGVQKYREAAMIEIEALREVSKYDKNSTRYETPSVLMYYLMCVIFTSKI